MSRFCIKSRGKYWAGNFGWSPSPDPGLTIHFESREGAEKSIDEMDSFASSLGFKIDKDDYKIVEVEEIWREKT